MKATGLGRSSIYAFIRSKEFPPPIKIGPRASAWDDAEVDAWLAGRKALRDAPQAQPAT